MRQRTLSQIIFITPEKAKGSKSNGHNYIVVSASMKDNEVRRSSRFEMNFKRFLESEKLDPQIAAIALYGSQILVFFDNHTYESQNYHISKPTNTVTNRILVEKLFKHFQENLDLSDGAINRFYLRFSHKFGDAHVFERVVHR